MASVNQPDEKLQDKLRNEQQAAWDALQPLRATWDEKEQALLARVNDSFSGNVVKAKVTDAALSTLAFERQARVAAQLPTGKVYPAGKSDEGKAKLANIALTRYIIPNANSQKPMLVKQRLWGVYASVYGSMPMFYDYRVDDEYIGPDCWLIDPRNFMPQPGRNSIQECDWVMISTIVTISELKAIVARKNTSWNKKAVQKLIDLAKDAKPSKLDDADKDSETSRTRYNKDQVKGQIELITKYERGEKGHWITFAPDYKDVDVLRDIPNPHKSGKIPVVMRDCFPLLNSIYGLGDFERGMRIQKAKDSLLGLRLEFVKNATFPPLKIDTSKVTASTIKYGAARKWLVQDMNNGVQAMTFGNQSGAEFQSTFSVLNTMLQNQFGTSDTTTSGETSANNAFGKTPQALKMLEQRENARDTWDRFMHEQAVSELYEGMINLLSVKMEKPINFTVFEEEIRQIQNDYPEDDILQVLAGGKYGQMTIPKKHLSSDKGLCYIIDANSSMQKDDADQLEALLQTYTMASQDPNLQAVMRQQGITWDQAEHFKKILIASGVSDWERILQEGQAGAGGDAAMAQQQMMAEQQAQQEMMQQQAMQQEQFMQQASQFQDPEVAQAAQMIINGGMQ